jgi:N-glycosylase/DNA lyase
MTIAALRVTSGTDMRGERVVLLRGTPLERYAYWGQPWQLGTAAYWINEAKSAGVGDARHSPARSLAEEVAFCILGGFGMPASTGVAAFQALRDRGLLHDPDVDAAAIESVLSKPLPVDGSSRKYRFPRQRAARLALALKHVRGNRPPTDEVDLRDWLQLAPGIGPKTASWVVRNHLDSDRVAIIDVHVARAGIVAGVFDSSWKVATDYRWFEAAFLEWSEVGDVRVSRLDTVIWRALARSVAARREILGVRQSDLERPVWPAEQLLALDGERPISAGSRRRVATHTEASRRGMR